ncbi:hypothetical protein BJ138DRAFT_1157450 [Hygrophoropsis aurantiaca]|uniref:Uncharacterized protein n=1 Tax=Hygrophoropsis aurantiaca TaxID=72124 RepID=A0ACB8A668_9AGAM|nr:hypothetical protein BJ138DRAFT_1157450 [Hygrophoropsis aurantiaca]
MSLNCSDLPNPFTKLAFLEPQLAYQAQISTYTLIGAAGALVWDILSHVIDDYTLIFKCGVGFPTIAYFVSRLSTVFFVLMSTIFDSTSVGHCSAFQRAINISFPIATSSTGLLFFFRVRAIYGGTTLATAFFGCLWLGVFACSLVLVNAVSATSIGTTEYCIDSGVSADVGAAIFPTLVYDTIVFVAISRRLTMLSFVDVRDCERGSHGTRMPAWVRAFLYGEYLPAFSRSLLRDGQIYYLVAVACNILSVVMLYMTTASVSYRIRFVVPTTVIANAMTCHVFRSTKFGAITEDGMELKANTNSVGTLVFRRNSNESTSRGAFDLDVSAGSNKKRSSLPVEV